MTETRAALVTGGNRGIGLEIVTQLAREGVQTVLGARDLNSGREAAQALMSEGLEPAVVELDVTDAASVAAAVAETIDLFGRIDILVNNAGVLLDRKTDGTTSTVEDVSLECIWQSLDANTVGPLRMIQAALPHMREAEYGRIVNISSGLGQLAEMGAAMPGYRLSKAALNALTRTAAADVAATNIKINSMCPGWVRTDMGGPDASRSVAEGAETAIWLATLADDGPSGGFFRDKKPIAW